MNYQKSKLLIKKIQDFIASLESSGGELLPMEQQLLQGYAKELFLALGGKDTPPDNSRGTSADDSTMHSAPEIQQPEAESPSTEAIGTADTELESDEAFAKMSVSQEKPPAPEEIAESHSDNGQHAENTEEPETTQAETPEEQKPQDIFAKAPKIKEIKVDSRSVSRAQAGKIIPLEVAELFHVQKAKDLSEQLSESKISDLTEAMGINEKIFTINELFDGDAALFDQTISVLHGSSSLQEAQDYLAKGVAQDLDWSSRDKKKKAKNFIKLVRRLF